MRAAAVSRRGFLTRAVAGAAGLLGGSLVGGLSTRAWAHPLHHLRAWRRPVIGQPRSVVPIGLDEALRREHRASRLPEVRAMNRELVRSGYRRSGQPVGVDGVAGWSTEGGRSVSLGFAKGGGEEATAFLVARWWDQKRRESWPCEDVMPDVYLREMIDGPSGSPGLVRFRYVDEEDAVAVREFEAGSVAVDCSDMSCHPHPPGPCPPSCSSGPAVCFHCTYWANVCTGSAPDCSACGYCSLCVHYACGAACAVTCSALCSTFTEKYCCDWSEQVCCPFDIGPGVPSIPDCL
jgi:hypothetical protein